MFDVSSPSDPFFTDPLAAADPEVSAVVRREEDRQDSVLTLIASENFVSRAVLEAQGSVFTNKYAEGYPGRRYYGGCEHADEAENLALDRVRSLYGCAYANVQPHSGSQANQAVLNALVPPGATILGMRLDAGGHLTHGASVRQSGRWFDAVQYGVREDDGLLDYEDVAALAEAHRPRLIIAGASSYPRIIDVALFREIADSVNALLLVDMAHVAGLVAGKVYPGPFPHAHVVTSTTHKTLRGPRGGFILSDDAAIGKKLDSSVFPGMQGGALMHAVAAKAVAFREASQPAYADYAARVVDNARVFGECLAARGFTLVTGGTDVHMLLVDLRPTGLTGRAAAEALGRVGVVCNRNEIPFDPLPPSKTSGVRFGTPAGTTRGFGPDEFRLVADVVADVLDSAAACGGDPDDGLAARAHERIRSLCARFPLRR